MAIYITLFKWTDQGRSKTSDLPQRAGEVEKKLEAGGVKVLGNYTTMGQYDQVSVVDAPDDATVAKFLMMIAGRGNAISETMRAFTMDELKGLL
jgi:uncharacterized protein with GYD domain